MFGLRKRAPRDLVPPPPGDGLYRDVEGGVNRGTLHVAQSRHQMGRWYISDITVDPGFRGQGIGRSLLQRVCADADAVGATLALSVLGSIGGMTDEQLIAWYARHGFVDRSETGDGDPMVREPKAKAQAA